MTHEELVASLGLDQKTGKITFGQYCSMLKALEHDKAYNDAKMETGKWQAAYWEIYKHYLGCAALLGEAMAYVSDNDLRESAQDAMLDAATFAGGKVKKLGRRMEIQFSHTAQATTAQTT